MNDVGSVIVSWDMSHEEDVHILLVGKQVDGKVDIINAFQGEDADNLYLRLMTVKKECPDGESRATTEHETGR